jgi:hypothetical protein
MHKFTKKLKEKGYRLKDAAKYWGVEQRQMSNICADPKPHHWTWLEGLKDKRKGE